MFVYLSKKIAIPNNVRLRCLTWNQKQGYIAIGGEDGLLKVIRTDSTFSMMGITKSSSRTRSLGAANNLSMNQTLEGHDAEVQVVTWNEEYQKLTSSDQNGVIIVWMLYKGSWYEEMINNRNKSVVKGMAWSSNGKKICIVYEDGAVIVGSVEGNRIWGKELKSMSLTAVQWSPDTAFLLFGLKNGEVQLYDDQGIFLKKLDNISEDRIDSIISLNWYDGKHGYVAINCPVLAICFKSGRICLLKNINDDNPIVVNTGISISCCAWNTFGSMFVLTGISIDEEKKDSSIVYFYSLFGERVKTLKIPGKEVTCCAWEGGSLRICLSVDSSIYFANIRPNYKWTFFGNTVVYSDEKIGKNGVCITFWNTSTNSRYLKYVKTLIGIASYGEHCVLAARSDPIQSKEQFTLFVCNTMSTSVDTKYLDFEPNLITMNGNYVFAASRSNFLIWNFRSPHNSSLNCGRYYKDKIFHVDDTPLEVTEIIQDLDANKSLESHLNQRDTVDQICSICATEKLLLVGRESGIIQQYSLPQVTLIKRYITLHSPRNLAINCDSTRATIIDSQGLLHFLELFVFKNGDKENIVSKFERKDVWAVCWAQDNPNLLAILEKSRMYIFRGLEPEEPITYTGYVCCFKNLEIRSVFLDELLCYPDKVQSELLLNLEVKSLRDTRELLESVSFREVEEFIRDNSHPRLWQLLAEHALRKLDLETAENSMVHCGDYLGIRFIKRLQHVFEPALKRAEVLAFLGSYDEAEQTYLDLDRRDLAIMARQKLADYSRAVQLMRLGSGGSNIQLEDMYAYWGEQLAARRNWEEAQLYMKQGCNFDLLLDCHYQLEEYDQLALLTKLLADQEPGLKRAAGMLASVGMCQQAVACFVRCANVKQAVEICIRSNRWDQALDLAHTWRLPGIDELLTKYARHLLSNGQRLQAVELFRKADCPLEAAKLLLELATEQIRRRVAPVRLKKLYVLAALLVQEHLARPRMQAQTYSRSSSSMGLDESDKDNVRVIEEAWRGAEAYHFLILVHRQLYAGKSEAAMITAVRLREYENILEQELVYVLLALTSCASRAFATCSRAFVLLEAINPKYEDLALYIFRKSSPRNKEVVLKAECSRCECLISDYCLACPNGFSSSPPCIFSGQPITNQNSSWFCTICKHRVVSERDIVNIDGCPLCHSIITYM